MSERSRAAVLEGPEKLSIREFPLPRLGADDGLLAIEMAGICQTDVKLYHGTTTYALPLVLGHEIVGRIVGLGDIAARRWGVKEGDRVAVGSVARCGFCRACVDGAYKFCTDQIGYGTYTSADRPPHLWGSYADYMYLAPGSLLYPIPDDLSLELALLLTVAVANGIQWTTVRGGVRLGDAVVIQGVGPIGLSCVAAAREAGASPVIATGLTKDRQRLQMALAFGADVVIDVETEDVVERVRELTGGDLADVVIDVTGSGAAVRASLKLVRTSGTVVSGGVTGDGTLSPLPLDELLYKETRLQGVYTSEASAVRRALKLLQRGSFPFERLITHRYPLSDAEEAVRAAGGELPDVDAIKVVIVPK
jgi:alcohol dehydrogenase